MPPPNARHRQRARAGTQTKGNLDAAAAPETPVDLILHGLCLATGIERHEFGHGWRTSAYPHLTDHFNFNTIVDFSSSPFSSGAMSVATRRSLLSSKPSASTSRPASSTTV